MICKKLSVLIILLTATVALAQSPIEDSLVKPPMAPSAKPRASKLDLSNCHISFNGNYLPNVFFFEPGSDKLDEAYLPAVTEMAARIVQNPDIRCVVRGFYSHEFDGIVSPIEGEALAKRRASALKEAFQLKHPQLSLKIEVASSGHEFTKPFGAEPSAYDLRAEISPSISEWSPRVIVATEEQPYWRRGFRQISEDRAIFLSKILARNPDLMLYFSSGIFLAPPKEIASRIDVVVSKFKKDMKKKDSRQIVAVYGGLSKPGELVINLWPSFLAPEPLNGEIIEFRSQTEIEPVRLDLGFEPASGLFAYRIDREIGDSRATVEAGVSRPTKLAIIRPGEGKSLLLPPRCDFSMVTWSENYTVERSSWLSVDVGTNSGYSESAFVPVVPFTPGMVEPRCMWESALPQIASRLQWLIKTGGSLRISITGHALDFEASPDSLALARAEYLGARLMTAMMPLLGKSSAAEIDKYLSDRGVVLEISSEVHSEENIVWAVGALKGLSPWRLMPLGALASIGWEFTNEK